MFIKSMRKVPSLVTQIVEAVADAMPPEHAAILRAQLAKVTRVYVADRVIDLYCVRRWWGRKRPAEPAPTFPNRAADQPLAEVKFRFTDAHKTWKAKLYLVRGRLFEIVLTVIPEGLLHSELEIDSVALSPGYANDVAEETPAIEHPELPRPDFSKLMPRNQREIRSWSAPRPRHEIEARLTEVFGSAPQWLLELLELSDGLSLQFGAIFSIREMRRLPLEAFDLCMIGEYHIDGDPGALGWHENDPEHRLHWVDHEDRCPIDLGNDLDSALSALRDEQVKRRPPLRRTVAWIERLFVYGCLTAIIIVVAFVGMAVVVTAFHLPPTDAVLNIVFGGLLLGLAAGAVFLIWRGKLRYGSSMSIAELESKGLLEIHNFTATRAFQVEEWDDEGSQYILELSDGSVLYVGGQHLYEYEPDDDPDNRQGRTFPCTDFTIRRHKTGGYTVEIECRGQVLEPECVAPPFTCGIVADEFPEDGRVYTNLTYDELKSRLLQPRG